MRCLSQSPNQSKSRPIRQTHARTHAPSRVQPFAFSPLLRVWSISFHVSPNTKEKCCGAVDEPPSARQLNFASAIQRDCLESLLAPAALASLSCYVWRTARCCRRAQGSVAAAAEPEEEGALRAQRDATKCERDAVDDGLILDDDAPYRSALDWARGRTKLAPCGVRVLDVMDASRTVVLDSVWKGSGSTRSPCLCA